MRRSSGNKEKWRRSDVSHSSPSDPSPVPWGALAGASLGTARERLGEGATGRSARSGEAAGRHGSADCGGAGVFSAS